MTMKVDSDLINISKDTRSVHTILYHESMTNSHLTLSVINVKHAR